MQANENLEAELTLSKMGGSVGSNPTSSSRDGWNLCKGGWNERNYTPHEIRRGRER